MNTVFAAVASEVVASLVSRCDFVIFILDAFNDLWLTKKKERTKWVAIFMVEFLITQLNKRLCIS